MFPVAGFVLCVTGYKKDYFRLTTRNQASLSASDYAFQLRLYKTPRQAPQLATRNIILQSKNNMLAKIDNKLSIWSY